MTEKQFIRQGVFTEASLQQWANLQPMIEIHLEEKARKLAVSLDIEIEDLFHEAGEVDVYLNDDDDVPTQVIRAWCVFTGYEKGENQ